MSNKEVYQVRAVDALGNQRIVHAYETDDQARQAIVMMKAKTRLRYTVVRVPNRPEEHWGIN